MSNNTSHTDHDIRWMQHAIRLGWQHVGITSPNPSVGCVIVSAHNQLLGYGVTARGGRPHAEPQALAMAGEAAKGATAYVTLEPCSHHGQTPPCAEALIAAQVKRVVIGCQDDDPRVSGKGVQLLQQAGIAVTLGVEQRDATCLHGGFLKYLRKQLPWVTLKLAFTQDGTLTTPELVPNWFTGKVAKFYAHRLRYTHDAIMVGGGTVRKDNARLTCRLPGLEGDTPARYYVSSQRAPADAAIQPAGWVSTSEAGDVVVPARGDDPHEMDMLACFKALAERGHRRVLLEGGGMFALACLQQQVVDEIHIIHSPAKGDLQSSPLWPVLQQRLNVHAFQRVNERPLGDDRLEVYQRG